MRRRFGVMPVWTAGDCVKVATIRVTVSASSSSAAASLSAAAAAAAGRGFRPENVDLHEAVRRRYVIIVIPAVLLARRANNRRVTIGRYEHAVFMLRPPALTVNMREGLLRDCNARQLRNARR